MPSGTWRILIFSFYREGVFTSYFLYLCSWKFRKFQNHKRFLKEKLTSQNCYWSLFQISQSLFSFYWKHMNWIPSTWNAYFFSRDKYKFYWNWSMIYFGMITAEQRVNILTFSYHKFTLWVRHLLPHKYQMEKKPSLNKGDMHCTISHRHNKCYTVLQSIISYNIIKLL